MATWKGSQERPAEAPSRRPVAECSGVTRCAPVGDTADDFEVTVRGENSMPAARGKNRMPKIPDAADEIEVLCATKGSLEDRQLQTTHLPHTPTR
jgi:hypothetical protein